MKINIKDLKKNPSDILLPVALFALCAGSVWLAVSSTKESLKVNAHTTIANASQWETTSGEVLSITTLPGKTSYSTGRAVQSWYANAEVAVSDDTVIVRLPDDTLVIEGSTLPLWSSTKTGEVRAMAPVSDLELRDAHETLASLKQSSAADNIELSLFYGVFAFPVGLLLLFWLPPPRLMIERKRVNLPAPHKRTGLEFEEGAAYSR